jgi:hypothetical protein
MSTRSRTTFKDSIRHLARSTSIDWLSTSLYDLGHLRRFLTTKKHKPQRPLRWSFFDTVFIIHDPIPLFSLKSLTTARCTQGVQVLDCSFILADRPGLKFFFGRESLDEPRLFCSPGPSELDFLQLKDRWLGKNGVINIRFVSMFITKPEFLYGRRQFFGQVKRLEREGQA